MSQAAKAMRMNARQLAQYNLLRARRKFIVDQIKIHLGLHIERWKKQEAAFSKEIETAFGLPFSWLQADPESGELVERDEVPVDVIGILLDEIKPADEAKASGE